jgi:hypothetical protein
MTRHWDEFSKLLAEPVPRRESMRRVGFALAGVVLGPLGLNSALARASDPCQSFCKCRNRSQQRACLAACKACSGDTRRLCGSCGSYVCCDSAGTCCGKICTNLGSDFNNCGACGHVCPQPGPNESGACVSGRCVYACVDGAVRCNGPCTFLYSDPHNCGACGNVCPESRPDCVRGVCVQMCPSGLTWCDPACVDLLTDPYNCGACNNQCAPAEFCSGGICQGICVGCY